MSGVLIQQYLAELARLREVSGTWRESVVREAFKDLLKAWGRQHDLTFVPEYGIESPAKERRYVDGALKARLKARLKADKDNGRIVLDSETTLAGVPPEAWEYKLGNRCALEWILDQYKEKKPKDPTIRERFNTYRFADYKDKVIDLLARVTRVSVKTQATVEAVRSAPRTS